VVAASCIVVDDLSTAIAQAGPLVAAVGQGLRLENKLVELGDLLAKKDNGMDFQQWRQSAGLPHGFVIYNSVGLGIQDAAVVEYLLSAGMQ
jgi:ornithine cyclodeaminase/alanine dehydrogenase-like protein (mu-crystallin family)